MSEIEAFTIAATDVQLADLRQRLSNTRWPEAELVEDWTQGIPLSYVQEVCEYWAKDYDWRVREALLNRFDHFRTQVDGLGIHFIHQRSPHPEARPLLITHGWPGSIVEFHKVIEPLVDPVAYGGDAADAFHVVAPSLPGFGFSDKPTETGWGVEKIATAWGHLMAKLGYDTYLAQGGDWGSAVTGAIGALDPDHCLGIHLNMPWVGPDMANKDNWTDEEKDGMAALKFYNDWDSGYSKQQATRPQTVAYGLADSPSGQAAWILEKFYAWTDNNGSPEDILSRDELLDNVMIYWLTQTAASSARLYWESFGRTGNDPINLPVGCSIFPKEIFKTSERWAKKRFTNLVHFNVLQKGGHFAALEQPEAFIGELRDCFRKMT